MKNFLTKHKLDIIVVGSLVLVALTLLLVFALTSNPGEYVEITVDGRLFGRYSLSDDAEIDIGGTNLLIIENGTAYMKEANCPNHTCVARGSISLSGQSIICLPNKIIVTVKGGKNTPDAVSS